MQNIRRLTQAELPRHVSLAVLIALLVGSASLFLFALPSRVRAAASITSGPTVGGITEKGAVISWTTDVEATTVVVFGTTSALEMGSRRVIIPGMGIEPDTEPMDTQHTYSFSTLSSGTTYYFKAQSVAADGVPVTSDMGTFTTKSAVVTCSEDIWDCGEWGECQSTGKKARTCTMKTDCPDVQTAEPEKEMACEYKLPVEEPKPPVEEKPVVEIKEPVKPPVETTIKEEPKPQPTVETPTAEPSEPAETPVATETGEGTTPTPTTEEASLVLPPPVPQEPEAAKVYVAEQVQLIQAAVSAASSGATLGTVQNSECAANGISREACYEWLSVRYSEKRCREAGILTMDKCSDWLTAQNNGVFPGCEGADETKCKGVKDLALTGYMSEQIFVNAQAMVEASVVADEVVSVAGITPVKPEMTGDVTWWPSVAVGEAETSSAVIVPDADGDGLPDGAEALYGSDPNNADTDGDGVSDSEEVKNGTNPAGEGDLGRELTPVEKNIVGHGAIEQPRGAGEVDSTYQMATAEAAPSAETPTGGVNVTGTCEPNSVCLLYIYSYVPMVYVASTDESGNFVVEVSQHVMDGEHTAYIALTDDTGKITKKSSPLSFFVREARAITEGEFLAPTAEQLQAEALPISEHTSRFTTGYIYAALVLVAVAAIAVWVNVMRMGKKKEEE